MTNRGARHRNTPVDCLDSIYSWKWRILALMLLLGGATAAVSLLIPQEYEIAADLEVIAPDSLSHGSADAARLAERAAETLLSDAVLRPVFEKHGLSVKDLSVEPRGSTIRVAYRHRDPDKPALLLESLIESFESYLRTVRLAADGDAAATPEARLAELERSARQSSQALIEFEARSPGADIDRQQDHAAAEAYQFNVTYAQAQADRALREAALQSLAKVSADDIRRTIIEAEVREARAREDRLRQSYEQVKEQAASATALAVEYRTLKQRAEADRRMLDEYRARLTGAASRDGLGDAAIRVSQPAGNKTRPVGPNTPLNVAVALAVSLAAGCVAAFVSMRRGGGIRKPSELYAITRAPRIVALPDVPQWRGLDGLAMFCEASQTPRRGDRILPLFREQIRGLCRSFARRSRGAPVIAVLSPGPGEGRSRIAVEMALACAAAGQRTLLIDANLRAPVLHALLFATGPRLGLATALSGDANWRDCIITGTPGPRLYLLPSGAPEPGSLALLRSRFAPIVAEAQREFDAVIVDTPPFLGCPENLDILRAAEAVVVVARSGHTTRERLAALAGFLHRLNVPARSAVLNAG